MQLVGCQTWIVFRYPGGIVNDNAFLYTIMFTRHMISLLNSEHCQFLENRENQLQCFDLVIKKQYCFEEEVTEYDPQKNIAEYDPQEKITNYDPQKKITEYDPLTHNM